MGQTVNLLAYAFGGSNPPFPTTSNAGIAQLARALAFQAKGRGFESRFPLHVHPIRRPGPRSSGVERILGKDEVVGSIPTEGSISFAFFVLRRSTGP